jgi:hypothetical protein
MIKGTIPLALIFWVLWLLPVLIFFTCDFPMGKGAVVLFGLPGGSALAVTWYNLQKVASMKRCEVCGRKMLKLEEGKGCVMISMVDKIGGIGTTEQCWECGRVYCDNCWPLRDRNSCVCGLGRDKIRRLMA